MMIGWCCVSRALFVLTFRTKSIQMLTFQIVHHTGQWTHNSPQLLSIQQRTFCGSCLNNQLSIGHIEPFTRVESQNQHPEWEIQILLSIWVTWLEPASF